MMIILAILSRVHPCTSRVPEIATAAQPTRHAVGGRCDHQLVREQCDLQHETVTARRAPPRVDTNYDPRLWTEFIDVHLLAATVSHDPTGLFVPNGRRLPERLVGSCGHHRPYFAGTDSGIDFIEHEAMRQRDAGNSTDKNETIEHCIIAPKATTVFPVAHGERRFKKSHGLVACLQRANT
jgi:hypothetical protein